MWLVVLNKDDMNSYCEIDLKADCLHFKTNLLASHKKKKHVLNNYCKIRSVKVYHFTHIYLWSPNLHLYIQRPLWSTSVCSPLPPQLFYSGLKPIWLFCCGFCSFAPISSPHSELFAEFSCCYSPGLYSQQFSMFGHTLWPLLQLKISGVIIYLLCNYSSIYIYLSLTASYLWLTL